MFKRLLTVRSLCLSAIIAALYAVLTWMFSSMSFMPEQLRLSEALTMLPVLFPQAIPGLTLGCLLGNIMSPHGLPDMIFGTLATLLASVMTWQTRNIRIKGIPFVSAIWPILFNAVIIGAMIHFVSAPDVPMLSLMLSVGVCEIIPVVLGTELAMILESNKAICQV